MGREIFGGRAGGGVTKAMERGSLGQNATPGQAATGKHGPLVLSRKAPSGRRPRRSSPWSRPAPRRLGIPRRGVLGRAGVPPRYKREFRQRKRPLGPRRGLGRAPRHGAVMRRTAIKRGPGASVAPGGKSIIALGNHRAEPAGSWGRRRNLVSGASRLGPPSHGRVRTDARGGLGGKVAPTRPRFADDQAASEAHLAPSAC